MNVNTAQRWAGKKAGSPWLCSRRVYVLVGGWLFPCPVQTLRGGFSPALAMMGEDGGTELWTCLGLSVKGDQCVAGPPGRGAPNMSGARGP